MKAATERLRHTPRMRSPHCPLPALSRARVAGAYARTAVDTARELGVDPIALGAACGLTGLAATPPEHLPVTTYLALLHGAAMLLGDPLFGLEVGRRMRLATYTGYGLVLCTCPTLRAAAEQTRRFEGLAHDLGRSEIIERDGIAHYRWHSPWLDLPGGRQLSESVMVGIRGFVTWLAGAAVPVIDVAFTHPSPPGAASLRRYQDALAAPVRFDAAVTEARFPADVLDAPLPNADPSLFPTLIRTAEQRLAEREREAREPAIVAEVRAAIRARLMIDAARLPEIAEQLGLSPRSLQRKLAEAGQSFSAVLDDTRRELAQAYLRDPKLSLTEIAFLLGFAEQSGFTHAFRGWFGTTPAAWRAAQAESV